MYFGVDHLIFVEGCGKQIRNEEILGIGGAFKATVNNITS